MLNRLAQPNRRAALPMFLGHRQLAPGVFIETGETEPTMEATRFGLENLTLLHMPLNAEGTLAFVAACQRPEGGFAMRQDGGSADLAATYYALRIFELLEAPQALAPEARQALHGWLRQQLFPDVRGHAALDIDPLYYAVRAWLLSTGHFTTAEHEAVVASIWACAGNDGGFAQFPGHAPDIERTYCCLHLLQELNVESWELPRQHAWISSCYFRGRVHETPQRVTYSLATLYWGTRAAELTQLRLPWLAIRQEVEHHQQADGGYGMKREATLWQTYCALGTLRIAESAEV
jgi:prenyltransferase beta subunit